MKALISSICLLVVLTSLITTNATAAEVVKTCSLVIKVPGKGGEIPTLFQIQKVSDGLIAKTTQTINGTSVSLPDEKAKVSEYSVRVGLTTDSTEMNLAEELIVSTAEFLSNPDFGNTFSVDLDLKSIRHAKVFEIGTFTHMGGTVIIEAQDKDGKLLGSFLTGFMPFACKR